MSVCLYDCLCEAKLGQYYLQLKSAGITNSEALSMLTMEDYTRYGVYQMDDRKRLFQLIQIIKNVQRANLDRSKSSNGLSHIKKKTKNGTIPQKELCQTLPLTTGERGVLNLYRSASYNVEVKRTVRDSPSRTVRDSPPRTSQQFKGLVTPKHSKTLPISSKSQQETLSPKTLNKLEETGGVLFVSRSEKNNNLKSKVTKKKVSAIRLSVSDSELLEDSTLPNNSNSLVDISQLKKESHVGTVFHNTGYNYGIPDGRAQTPNKKYVSKSKQSRMLNAPMRIRDEMRIGPLTATPKIIVCVRKRPVNRRELQNNEVNVVEVDGESSVLVNEVKTTLNLTKFVQEHKFHFDEVFHENCSNEEVYIRTARPLLHTVFNKGKATCFAYGQTGAGKTHTMMGSDKVKGLYLLAAQDIFQLQQSGGLGCDITTWTSYFEIYCGNLYDLLNNRQRLHAREDAQHRVNIVGLKEVRVLSADGLLQVVEHGNRIRSKGCSGVNSSSSRSHAVLQIELKDPSKHPIGRLSFIDLAGSERACDTVDPDKLTRIEGAEINTSLLALKECIRALDQDQKHTPFRQSKLTQVLKDSFIGNSRTCMIANVSPNIGSTEHTLNTLRYADRVKELRKDPLHKSGSTPKSKLKLHPPTPTTFTPATTSTPMKTSKKLATPKSHQGAAKHANHVLNSPSYVRNDIPNYCATPHRNQVTTNAQAQLHSKRNLQRSQKITPDSSREHFNSPVSKSKEVLQKSISVGIDKGHPEPSRDLSRQSIALPVWQPIETEEVARTPNQRNKAWEVKNERYVLKSNGHRSDGGKGDNAIAFENNPTPEEPTVEVKQSSSIDKKWYLRNNSSKIKEVMSPSRRSGKHEAKASTDELLAEIDEALRNSVVLSPEATDQLYSARREDAEVGCKAHVGNDNDLLLTSPIVLKQKSLMSLGEIVQSSFDSVSTDSLNRHPTKSISHDVNANIAPLKGVNVLNAKSVSEGRIKKMDYSQMKSEADSGDKIGNPRITPACKKDTQNLPSARTISLEQTCDQDIQKPVSNSSEKIEKDSGKHQPTRANSFPTASSYRSLRMGTLSARKLDFAMEVLTKAMNPVKKESVKMTTFAEQRMKSSLWKSFQTFSDTRETPHQLQSNGYSTKEVSSEENEGHSVVKTSAGKADGSISSEQRPSVENPVDRRSAFRLDEHLPTSFAQSQTSDAIVTNEVEVSPHRRPVPMYQSTPIVKECFASNSYQHLMEEHVNSPVVLEKVSEEDLTIQSGFANQAKTTLTNGAIALQEAVGMEAGKQGISSDSNSSSDDTMRMNVREVNKLDSGSTQPITWQPMKGVKEVEVATPRSTKHLRSKSAVEKAQNLLFLTHIQQLQEIRNLCDREMELLNETKKGNKDFFEYLTLTQNLQETKLHRIQTFKDQLETFHSFSSPEISPASSKNSSFHW